MKRRDFHWFLLVKLRIVAADLQVAGRFRDADQRPVMPQRTKISPL
jgi:hypothetical protein